MNEYSLLDSGLGMKLERFGAFVLSRPDPQAIWNKSLSEEEWGKADAVFGTKWEKKNDIPESQVVEVGGFKFKLSLNTFKHTGIFPEQEENWKWIEEKVKEPNKLRVLNLFGYTGGATLALAKAGTNVEVTHVDSSKQSVSRAKENLELSGLGSASVRWIVEDVRSFVKKEIRRGAKYDGLVLDPPSFGRGAKNEVWKFEEDIVPLLLDCRKIMEDSPSFILFNGYASGFTALSYAQILSSIFDMNVGDIEKGELCIKEAEKRGFLLPAGIYARMFKIKS